MLTLKNSELTIDMLDPRDTTDRERLGWRFAHGGLIWQVSDHKVGPLLTGPEWPEKNPNPFNAQGLVESFRHRTRDMKLYTWRNGVGVAIGCGRIALDVGTDRVVTTQPCLWDITTHDRAMHFSTKDAFAGFDYSLMRSIELSDRTVTVRSSLTNLASQPLVLEWFAHPFFAYTDGLIRARMPSELRMNENVAFTLQDGELAMQRRFTGPNDGHMEVVPWPQGVTCAFSVSHPKLTGIENELIGVKPFECVIWGNESTFSIEPYVKLELAPGETHEFAMRHTFGARK